MGPSCLWQCFVTGIAKEELHILVVGCLISYAAFEDMTNYMLHCWWSSSNNAGDHHHRVAGLRWNGFVALLSAPPRLSYFLTSTPPSQPDNTYFQVTDTKEIIWPQIEKYLLTLCIFCLQPYPSFLHSQISTQHFPRECLFTRPCPWNECVIRVMTVILQHLCLWLSFFGRGLKMIKKS